MKHKIEKMAQQRQRKHTALWSKKGNKTSLEDLKTKLELYRVVLVENKRKGKKADESVPSSILRRQLSLRGEN